MLASLTAFVLSLTVLPVRASEDTAGHSQVFAQQLQFSHNQEQPARQLHSSPVGVIPDHLQGGGLVEEHIGLWLMPEVAQRLANGSLIFVFCARRASQSEFGTGAIGAEQLGILATASGVFAADVDLPADVFVGLCVLLLYADSASDATAALGRESAITLIARVAYAAVYARMTHVVRQGDWVTDFAIGFAVAAIVAIASRWAASLLASFHGVGAASFLRSRLKPQLASELAPPFEVPTVPPAPDTSNEQGSPELDFRMQHLEPADVDGLPSAFFRKLLRHQMRDGAPLSGRIVARPPESALLGAGNFGQVWRARHARTGVLFAVKNLDPRRSERECDAASRLADLPHPCVVAVLGQHRFQDVPLVSIVMGLCAAGDLSSRISGRCRGAPGGRYAPPPEAASWAGQVLSGLEHLHLRAGLALLDLKPANVLLDCESRARLADFGLARDWREAARQGVGGPVAGSPGYAAPEVLAREGASALWRADLYALGALLHVLLTGGDGGQPPSSAHLMRSEDDHGKLADDWRLMQRASADAIAEARDPGARAGMELAAELVARDPEERPGHDLVRASPYLQGR